MEAYSYICLDYENNDEIILIGFSRGAFTARCVIDLIDSVGILSKRALGSGGLYTVFSHWWNNKDPREDHRTFDFTVGPSATRNHIKACGLWDTVHSVGLAGILGPNGVGILGPNGLTGFRWNGPHRLAPGRTIVTGVDHIFHALSLHERRSTFQPAMMSVLRQQQQIRTCEMEQCWLSGYHGDIGGGRRDDALAHLALAWMMAKLHSRLCLDFDIREFWQNEMTSSSWRTDGGEFSLES